MSSGNQLRWRSVIVRAPLGHLLVSALAALATPVLGGRRGPVVIWGLATVALIAILVRSANARALAPDRREPIGRVVIAIVVAAIAAFLGFVVMVNVWERFGIPH